MGTPRLNVRSLKTEGTSSHFSPLRFLNFHIVSPLKNWQACMRATTLPSLRAWHMARFQQSPTLPEPPRRHHLVVTAAKDRSSGSSSKPRSRKGGGGNGGSRPPGGPAGKPSMQSLAGEEILLFDPVAPSRDALKVRELPHALGGLPVRSQPSLTRLSFFFLPSPGGVRLPQRVHRGHH